MKVPFIALTTALPLTACISFGAKPPPQLLTLESSASVPVGQVQSSDAARSVTVLVPTVPQSLSTPRVPVQVTPTAIAYVEQAQWAEPPNRLFARLLGDTLTARTGRVVLSQAQSMSDPGARLGGELRSFGMDAATHEAVVVYDASLIRSGATAVEKRRFEARVPAPVIDATTAGPAISQAANQVAGQVADWVGR